MWRYALLGVVGYALICAGLAWLAGIQETVEADMASIAADAMKARSL